MGFTLLSRVASAAGLPESEVESELIDLAVAGLVTRIPGDFGGWGLTEAGRAADSERITAELAIAGTRPVVASVYDEFMVLNPELLDLCTAWQTRSADGTITPNDHTDPAYDSRVLTQFAEFHQRALATCAPLACSCRSISKATTPPVDQTPSRNGPSGLTARTASI